MIKTKLNLKFWKNKTLFVSGGTGTFGKNFLKIIIEMKLPIKKLIIFSRDELKQSELKSIYPISKYKFLRYFIGDIRDKDRLELALKDVDIIFHAAALNQVDTAEYNPTECIKTNLNKRIFLRRFKEFFQSHSKGLYKDPNDCMNHPK